MKPSHLTIAGSLLWGLSMMALACNPRVPTTQTGPGPHDFSHAPQVGRLWHEGDQGEPLYLRARVLDVCGKPVANARVRILHADQDGEHDPQRWRTHLETDERGTLKIVTVFPGYTGGLPRHIHFLVDHPEHASLTTRLFFKNDPSFEHGSDDLSMVLEEVQRDGKKGWVASFEFVLAAK